MSETLSPTLRTLRVVTPDQWIVTVEKTVRTTVVCAGCTEGEARANPFAHAIDEQDGELVDWIVLGVEAGP